MTLTTASGPPGAAAERDSIDAVVAEELGALFRVERLERRGPLSCVYTARDVATQRMVALKVLPRAFTAERTGQEFEAAMAAVATLDHTHIIPVYGYGRTRELLWYSMKRVEGRSLDDILREAGPLELRACLRLVEQLANALHYAHRRGVTHGNVKPANVIVASEEVALLGDFAVARAVEAGAPLGDGVWRSRLARYVAPEEGHLRRPGPAADQYALAVLALECLGAGDSGDGRAAVPEAVRQALARATTQDPLGRFATVLDLVAALEGGTPARQPSGGPLAAPRATAPVLLWDDEYEPAVPRGRLVRRLGVGAALVILVAGGAVSGLRLTAPDRPVPAQPRVTAEPAAPVSVLPARAAQAPPESPATSRPPPRPRPSPRPMLAAPGRLFVGATPWGELYIDDRLMGHTPKAALPIAAGWHQVRIVRDGFAPFEQRIRVAPGEDVRLIGIVLRNLGS